MEYPRNFFNALTLWLCIACLGCFLAFQPTARAEGDAASFAFSLDGARLVTADTRSYMDTSGAKPTLNYDPNACLWDARTGKLIATLPGQQGATRAVAFSPDGTRIATVGDELRLWEVRTGKLIAKGVRAKPQGELIHVAFSPDSARVLTISSANAAILWDAHTGKRVARLQQKASKVYPVGTATFSPDSTRIVTGTENGEAPSLCLWDGRTGKFQNALEQSEGNASRLLFSPDGTRIAIARGKVFSQSVCLWDGRTGRKVVTLGSAYEERWGGIEAAAFSPDGARIAVSRFAQGAYLFDARTGATLAAILKPGTERLQEQEAQKRKGISVGQEFDICDFRFSPDGARLFTYQYDRRVWLCDGRTGKRITLIQKPVEQAAQDMPMDDALAITFSLDCNRFVAADADTARLWDGRTGKLIATLPVPEGLVSRDMPSHPGVLLSPEGNRVVTSSSANTAYLWDGNTGKLIAKLPGRMIHKSFAP